MNITLSKVKEMDAKSFSFGALMTIATKIDTHLDKALKTFDLTSKQWFLMMILRNLFDSPPTLKQVAAEMGCSYQNVKQMAMQLQSKGLLKLVKDQQDARALRLILTEDAAGVWDDLVPIRQLFINQFYENIPEADLIVFKITLMQLLKNLMLMD